VLLMKRALVLRPFAVMTAAVVLFAACGGDDDDDATKATTTTKKQAATTTVTVAEAPIAPLTGMPEVTPGAGERGVIAVKIDNVPGDGRPPQAGIDVADVVFEEPVEGTTRLLAVFHSDLPERVGPIRSTRFIDPGIVWNLSGLYVYSGGTAPKVAAIKASPIQTVDENGMQQADARIRDSQARAPHNLFAVPQKLWAWEGATQRTPPEPLFEYLGDGQAFTGTPTSTVAINNLTKARYTWDATDEVWKREALIDGSGSVKPHLAESGTQVTPKNVIVQRISGLEDKSVMTGTGQAWVCTQGQCVTGTWSRPTLDDPTVFLDENGQPLRLTPGTTWVHFLDKGEPTLTP
jgi:hypothetical protein